MGVVYKTLDLRLDRPVALKFLPPDLTRDPEVKHRFIHEAKASSALQDPNVCVVHDIDETPDGRLFIVMEYLEGETLMAKIGRGTVVERTCRRTSRYVVLLPRSGNPLGGKFAIVRPSSRTGRASHRMPAMRVARGTRIPYLILLKDGDTYKYVAGNSAPIIIVWQSPPTCRGPRERPEQNDRLPPHLRQRTFRHPCAPGSRFDGLLASLGIPPDEVDLVLVNGRSVALQHLLEAGDAVSLYPVFESFDIGSVTAVRAGTLRRPAFVLDVHLGKLAHLLRMFGFDASYRDDFTDEDLVRISAAEGRTLLSKDRALVARDDVTRGLVIRSQIPREQLLEVMRRLDLFRAAHPFTLCLECNKPLREVGREAVLDRLPPAVRSVHADFTECPACRRVYWKGSHHARMEAYVAEILGPANRANPLL
jgi:uncharacterized protein with PIN domain/sulfur carrier protein ThiS